MIAKYHLKIWMNDNYMLESIAEIHIAYCNEQSHSLYLQKLM